MMTGRKNLKKLLALLLVMVQIPGFLPIYALADEYAPPADGGTAYEDGLPSESGDELPADEGTVSADEGMVYTQDVVETSLTPDTDPVVLDLTDGLTQEDPITLNGLGRFRFCLDNAGGTVTLPSELWFSFTPSEDVEAVLTTPYGSTYGDYYGGYIAAADLYDPSAALVGGYDSESSDRRVRCTMSAGGTYTIRIRGQERLESTYMDVPLAEACFTLDLQPGLAPVTLAEGSNGTGVYTTAQTVYVNVPTDCTDVIYTTSRNYINNPSEDYNLSVYDPEVGVTMSNSDFLSFQSVYEVNGNYIRVSDALPLFYIISESGVPGVEVVPTPQTPATGSAVTVPAKAYAFSSVTVSEGDEGVYGFAMSASYSGEPLEWCILDADFAVVDSGSSYLGGSGANGAPNFTSNITAAGTYYLGLGGLSNQVYTVTPKMWKMPVSDPVFSVTTPDGISYPSKVGISAAGNPGGTLQIYYYVRYGYAWDDPALGLYTPYTELITVPAVATVFSYASWTEGEGEEAVTFLSPAVSEMVWPDQRYLPNPPYSDYDYSNNIFLSGSTFPLYPNNEASGGSLYYITSTTSLNPTPVEIYENGNRYTDPFVLSGDTGASLFIYAIEASVNGLLSQVGDIQVVFGTPPPKMPVFSPTATNDYGVHYTSPQTVTIATATPGADIYYTINTSNDPVDSYGNLNTEYAILYTGPISVENDTWIKAVSYDPATEKTSWKDSWDAYVTAKYIIDTPKTITPDGTEHFGSYIYSHEEEFSLNITEAGTYKITVNRFYSYWDSPTDMTISLYNSDKTALIAGPVGGGYKVATPVLTAALTPGTYELVMPGYWQNCISYSVKAEPALGAPVFTADPADPHESGYYNTDVTLTLTPPANTPDGYEMYWTDYAGENPALYTVPVTLTASATKYVRGGVDEDADGTVDLWSDVKSLTVYIDKTAPLLGEPYSGRILYSKTSGGSYYALSYNGDTMLDGTVYLKLNLNGPWDADSGLVRSDYYVSVNDGAFYKIGSADLINNYGTWSVSEFAWDSAENLPASLDGSVKVRFAAVIYDAAGNPNTDPSALETTYDSDYAYSCYINNKPVSAPGGIEATAVEGGVQIDFSPSADVGYGYYEIFRASSLEALAAETTPVATLPYYYATTYTDLFYTPAGISGAYYYAVRGVDVRGWESGRVSTTEPVTPLPDTTEPTFEIYGLIGDNLSAGGTISLYAYDNLYLKTFSVTLKNAAEEQKWTKTNINSEVSASSYIEIPADTLMSESLASGDYTIIVSAEDCFGNTKTLEKAITLDKVPAALPAAIEATPLPEKIRVSWTASPDGDIAGYYVWRCATIDGVYVKLNYWPSVDLSYDDADAGAVDSIWYYKIQTVDAAGNLSALSAEAVEGRVGFYTPTLRVESPNIGENFRIYFGSFKPYETVSFYLDSAAEPFSTAYAYDFETYITYTPDGYSFTGTHTIRAVGETSGAVALTRFTVSDLSPSLTLGSGTVTVGGSVSFSASGLSQYGTAKVYLDIGDAVPIYTTTVWGSLSTSVTIPFGTAPGRYVFTLVDETAGVTVTAPLTVIEAVPALSSNVETPLPGGYITLSATGFYSGEAVEFFVDGVSFGTVDYYYGTWAKYLYLPEAEVGATGHFAQVLGLTSGLRAYLFIPLSLTTPAIYLPAEAVAPQVNFSITGSGFKSGEAVDIYIDGARVGTASNSGGSVSYTYKFAYAAPSGKHSAEFIGTDSGKRAGGSVTLARESQLLSIMQQTLVTEEPVNLVASGFKAGERVYFYMNGMNGASLGYSTADASGIAAWEIASLGVVADAYLFRAVGNTTGYTAICGTPEASGGLTIDYSAGTLHPGSSVELTVSGLSASESAGVLIGNIPQDAVTANESGTATVTVNVPAGYTAATLRVAVYGGVTWGSVSLPISALNPSVTASAQSVQAGGDITVTATGYAPGEALTLYFNGSDTGESAAASISGGAVFTFSIPAKTSAGTYTLSVFGTGSGTILSKSVAVTAPAPTVTATSSAVPGTSLTLSATGLLTGEIVHILYDGKSITGEGLSESGGAIAKNDFTIPISAAAGAHTLTFVFSKAGTTVTKTLTVTGFSPAVTAEASEEEGTFGAVLTISGLRPGEDIAVLFDSRDVTGASALDGDKFADASGNAALTYSFDPSTPAGVHGFKIIGKTSRTSAYCTLEVTEQGQLVSALNASNNAEGKPGDTLTVTASGFTPGVTVTILFGDTDVTPTTNRTVGEYGYTASIKIPLGIADGVSRVTVTAASVGESAATNVRVDTAGPNSPVIGASAAKRSVTVTWTRPSDTDIASYKLYRKAAGKRATRSPTRWARRRSRSRTRWMRRRIPS